jgi:hypothetical protein
MAGLLATLSFALPRKVVAQISPGASNEQREYLWYEAENMRGFSTNELNEPVLNPSYSFLPKAKAPGWGINGPGVSAEWAQGGESEWNSAAASADETKASIYQDIEVPRDGVYRFWVRYADWANKDERFTVRIIQQNREVFRHEFGAKDLVDPHDEISMYWGWSFTWDGADAKLAKGSARVSLEIERSAAARRHVDCWLLTNDDSYVPSGRQKPPLAAAAYLARYMQDRPTLAPLVASAAVDAVPPSWKMRPLAGRDFLMPWNIAKEFWTLYDKPEAERPLYPFHTEMVDEFVKNYAGKKDVPLFSSKLVVPVIYINDAPQLLKEGSAFLRYLRQTQSPFAILINYGTPSFSEADGQAAWNLLNGELKGQFLGWISGESIGNVWPPNKENPLDLTPQMSRRAMLDALQSYYSSALEKKWLSIFHTRTGPQWDRMIVAQSTSSTSFAHALGEWGSRLIGIETAAVQPGLAMRIAFTRGAARQYGGSFLYYHAPNFGDTALTFTKTQNFAGPDYFYHSRYGETMGPSLSWYRKSYYAYYMMGASAIYLEQGYDQFFKPGPGDHPFQLNPLGRITSEFMQFAERHPDRGTPYTPVAFLLDPAHGWDMTDYPQWPFGVAQIDRNDRALRELFGVAYYPMLVNEGEPATADRQAFVSSAFGDIFDVLVAADSHAASVDSYRAAILGGKLELSPSWSKRLMEYVKGGGVVFMNAAQAKSLPPELTGVRLLGASGEATDARCLAAGEGNLSLAGQAFRYEKVTPQQGAQVLIQSSSGDPLVVVSSIGKGKVIFDAVPDLLGLDERMTPFSAHAIAHLLSDISPVEVRGDVEYLINRNTRGWVVTLINNRGVFKPQQGLAEVDRSESSEVTVSVNSPSVTVAREWTGDTALALSKVGGRTVVNLRVPPGGVKIIEFVER